MNYDFSCLEVYDSFGFPQASYNSQYEHCTELVSTTASFLYQCHSVHGSMSDHGTPSSIASPLTTPVFFDAFLFHPGLSEDWVPSNSYPNPPHLQIHHMPTWQPMSNHGLPAPTLSSPSLHIGGDIYSCPNHASWPTANEYPASAATEHGYHLPNGNNGLQRIERSRKRQAPYRVNDHEGAESMKKELSQKTSSSERLGCDNNMPKSATRRNNKKAHQPPSADQQVAGLSSCVARSPVPPPPQPLATLDPPTAENPMRAARSIIRGHAHKKDKEITFVNECNLEWWEPYTTPKKSVE